MNEKILFVDDDPNILSGFQRMLRGRFQVETAPAGASALEKLNADPNIAVIVSDYRMPGMNGVEFLAQVAQARPESVRMLLTGEADTKAAGAAVNQGQIFRFLLKPCPAMILEKNLNSALQHHRTMHAERDLLEQTLRGSMEVMVDLLSLVETHSIGQSLSVYATIRTLLENIPLSNKWEFEIAGLLSSIGYISVPSEILQKTRKGEDLSAAEQKLYDSHATVAATFLARIPRLELVSAIVATQGAALPKVPAWLPLDQMDRLALGAHLLDLAIRWERFCKSNLPRAAFSQELHGLSYPMALSKAAEQLSVAQSKAEISEVHSGDLVAGMKLESDLVAPNGVLLLSSGQILSATIAECLRRRHEYFGTDEIVKVSMKL
jgi:CheY-like chemotaxis protein